MTKNAYGRNHILSECLLERFQDTSGNVVRYDIARSKPKNTKPGLEGFMRNLWTRTTKQTMETLWNQQAESDIKVVLEKIDKREKLHSGDVELLARFCAVHFVRSKEFIKLYEAIRQNHAKTESIKFPEYGFVGRYIVRIRLLKQTQIPCQFFEDQMKLYYQKSVDYLKQFGLEIRIAAGEGRLILPDGGLLIADAQAGKYQPTGGVSLLDSRQAMLPLSPIHLLGFNSKVKRVQYVDMNDTNVSNANGKLLYACYDSYYYHPGDPPKFT